MAIATIYHLRCTMSSSFHTKSSWNHIQTKVFHGYITLLYSLYKIILTLLFLNLPHHYTNLRPSIEILVFTARLFKPNRVKSQDEEKRFSSTTVCQQRCSCSLFWLTSFSTKTSRTKFPRISKTNKYRLHFSILYLLHPKFSIIIGYCKVLLKAPTLNGVVFLQGGFAFYYVRKYSFCKSRD